MGWWEEPDQIAPPWTSPQMAHHPAASPRPSQRRPASIPATTCRNRNEAQVDGSLISNAGTVQRDCG